MSWIKFKKEEMGLYESNRFETMLILSAHPCEGTDYDTEGYRIFLNHVPSTIEISKLLIALQEEYDKSNDVNGFYYKGKEYWLSKETRLGLLNSMQIEKESGESTTRIWLGDTGVDVSIDDAVAFLKQLELYAVECCQNTKQHLSEIKHLNSRDSLFTYDVTKGYPKKIEWIIDND